MQHANDSANTRAHTTATTTKADTPTPRRKADTEARNKFVMDIVGTYCEMDNDQRKILVDALRAKQARFEEVNASTIEEISKLSDAEKIKLIRFMKALVNDDVAELKAIKASSEDWPEYLDSSITNIEQGKHHQPDLTIPDGYSLDEKLEFLLSNAKVLRAGEVTGALTLIDMSGVNP